MTDGCVKRDKQTHQVFLVSFSEQVDGFALDGMQCVIGGLKASASHSSTKQILINIVDGNLQHK